MATSLKLSSSSDPSTKHPKYTKAKKGWTRVKDCIEGEDTIKAKRTDYLPQPDGMKGDYEAAYDAYIERAHFPQICSYALQGALGVIITKLPEFNLPPALEYLKKNATKEGISLQQLFVDIIIEVLATGRCPLMVDINKSANKFTFVRYGADALINWKQSTHDEEEDLIVAVLEEFVPETDDILSHDTESIYRILYLNNGVYNSEVHDSSGKMPHLSKIPKFMGKTLDYIPLVVAGSINNSFDIQPAPLLSVANCSIQIYRKEADLANSEFLSCNPTLILSGASNEDNLPNVVGSSIMIAIPDPQARVYYTKTDTAALTHVKEHIKDLYEEAIRHGVSILDTRKGVESAEALRIRQATQSASVYSIYLSALNAIRTCLYTMCEWIGISTEGVQIDAPSALSYGIPDSNVIRAIIEGFGQNVIPLEVIHRYMIGNGLLDQSISYNEYVKQLMEQKELIDAGVWGKPKQPQGQDGTVPPEEEQVDDEELDGKTGSSKKKPKAVDGDEEEGEITVG